MINNIVNNTDLVYIIIEDQRAKVRKKLENDNNNDDEKQRKKKEARQKRDRQKQLFEKSFIEREDVNRFYSILMISLIVKVKTMLLHPIPTIMTRLKILLERAIVMRMTKIIQEIIDSL